MGLVTSKLVINTLPSCGLITINNQAHRALDRLRNPGQGVLGVLASGRVKCFAYFVNTNLSQILYAWSCSQSKSTLC